MAPDTSDAVDREIRRAIEAEALAAPLPDDLAQRTLARADQIKAPPALGGRLLARLGRARLLVYSGAAAAVLAGFLVVGVVVTSRLQPPQDQSTVGARFPDRSRPTEGPEPVPGQETGSRIHSGVPSPAPARRDAAMPSTRSEPSTIAPDQAVAPPSGLPAPAPSGPRVARTAELDVQVGKARFEERWSQAEAVAGRFGGFVTSSSADEVQDRLARGRLTLRVPADRLDAALEELRRLGTPRRLTTSANDVSGQLVDYDARLRAAHANEAQLLDLLRQARTVADNLAIRPRLEDVQREIETLQAQRASLQGRVDLASISVILYERDAISKPEGRISQAWRQAADGVEATVAGMVVTAGYLGPLLVVALGLWLALRAVRHRRRFL